MSSGSITIDRRFCGPPDSGNGGYVCGRLAAYIDGPSTLRLLAPPPLERPLAVVETDTGLSLRDGDQVVAEARPGGTREEPPPAPDLAAAADASSRFSGFVDHWFPGCFVCGPDRAVGDGLRLFTGPLADQPERVAAPWRPGSGLSTDGRRIADEFLWSALDCPGAFAAEPAPGTAVLLGQMEGELRGSVAVGEDCTVQAWPIHHDGRKHTVGTAIYGADGECRALARAIWIEIPRPVR